MDSNEIYVLDNIIPQDYQNYLYNLFSNDISFFGNGFVPTTTYRDKEKFNQYLEDDYNLKDKVYEANQLIHPFFEKGRILDEKYHEIIPILHYVQSHFCFSFKYEPLRIKANLKLKIGSEYKEKINTPHVDIPINSYNNFTILYYINDSDGDTIIFNESYNDNSPESNFTIREKITPKQGRIVIFPTRLYHSGSHCVDSNVRCVLNINIAIN